MDEIRLVNRPLAPRQLLHSPRTTFELGAAVAGRPPEGEEDGDGDGVPDVTECAVETGLGDPQVPILHWRDGFEAGDAPGAPGPGWTVEEGAGCSELAAGRSRAGARSLRVDATTEACARGILVPEEALAGAADPLLVGAWFYDEGADEPIAVGAHLRLELHGGGDGAVTSVGFQSSLDDRRYTLSRNWTEPPLRRVVRGRGWHLVGLIRHGDGRTWGYLDGQLLGTVPSVSPPLTLKLSAGGLRAWFDEVTVLTGELEVGPPDGG